MCSNKKTGKTGHAQRKWVISEPFKYCNSICTCFHGHMLSFTCFWCIYIFHLYVYICLYHVAKLYTATSSTCQGWWQTRVWDHWNSWFQDPQLAQMQTPILCQVVRLWRHWWRNLMATSYQARTCTGTRCWFPCPVPAETRSLLTHSDLSSHQEKP